MNSAFSWGSYLFGNLRESSYCFGISSNSTWSLHFIEISHHFGNLRESSYDFGSLLSFASPKQLADFRIILKDFGNLRPNYNFF